MKTTKKFSIIILTFSLLTLAELCFARAGGGGGGGGGTGGGLFSLILAFILAPFLLVYSAIVSVKLQKKRNKVVSLTKELAKHDKLWNYRFMMARVEQTFFKVQEAWMERNQDLARENMSDRIYTKHKLQTDEMIRNGTKNMLLKMNLSQILIINLEDYQNNSEDTFSAYVKGSMIDFTINVNTGKIIAGNDFKEEDFSEIWTFIREKDTWVLDEIDQKVSFGDLNRSKAYTETKESL